MAMTARHKAAAMATAAQSRWRRIFTPHSLQRKPWPPSGAAAGAAASRGVLVRGDGGHPAFLAGVFREIDGPLGARRERFPTFRFAPRGSQHRAHWTVASSLVSIS